MISALRARCAHLTSTREGLIELALGSNRVGLWEQWTPEPTTGCYLWTGDFINTRYGTVALCGVRMLAHRIVHALLLEPVPAAEDVHHICLQRACINPAHLISLTVAQHKAVHAGTALAWRRVLASPDEPLQRGFFPIRPMLLEAA